MDLVLNAPEKFSGLLALTIGLIRLLDYCLPITEASNASFTEF